MRVFCKKGAIAQSLASWAEGALEKGHLATWLYFRKEKDLKVFKAVFALQTVSLLLAC